MATTSENLGNGWTVETAVLDGSERQRRDDHIEKLRKLRKLGADVLELRDAEIFSAKVDGLSLRVIGDAAGLNHQTINKIWAEWPGKRQAAGYPPLPEFPTL